MEKVKVIAEQQADGRWKFAAVYPLGTRLLNGSRISRSVRSWKTKRAAIAAGLRSYPA